MLSAEENQRSCAFSFGQDDRELMIESTSANEVRGFISNKVKGAMSSF